MLLAFAVDMFKTRAIEKARQRRLTGANVKKFAVRILLKRDPQGGR